MKTIVMNMENSKTSAPHKFLINSSHILDLKSLNKLVAFQNLSLYYTWKNIRKQHKNDKLKIIAPAWNDEFELPDGFFSVPNIEDRIVCIIKNYEKLPANPPSHTYISRINSRLVFKKNMELS